MDYEQLATEHSQLTTYTKQSNNIVIIYIYTLTCVHVILAIKVYLLIKSNSQTK